MDAEPFGKVLAFFGGDPAVTGPSRLRNAVAAGFTLLPLDGPAIAGALRAGVPCVTADDLVPHQEWLQIKRLAALSGQGWFEGAREDFSSDGICWPEFDAESMYWFWLEVHAAEALARHLQRRGCSRLECAVHAPPRPALAYLPSDVTPAFWASALPAQTRCEPAPAPRPDTRAGPSALSRLKRALRSAGSRLALRGSPGGRPLTRRIVLAVNPGEAYRFAPVLSELRARFPGRLAMVFTDPPGTEARGVAGRHGVPWTTLPAGGRGRAEDGERFSRGLAAVLRDSGNAPWNAPLRHLPFHFEHYCRRRWPHLAAAHRAWGSLWADLKPEAVIVSSLPDAESQLPAAAAVSLGIPTLAVPHGGGRTRAVRLPAAEHVLYANETMRQTLLREGAKPRRLIACRGLLPHRAYRTESPASFGPGERRRILVLTTSTGYPGLSVWRIRPRAQLEALRALAEPPPDLAGRLSICVKSHPGQLDEEFLAAAHEGLRPWILPPEADLHPLLESTDVVVALNYFGSALVHAVRAHKAVLFFITDDLIGGVPAAGHADFHLNCDLYLPAGSQVRTGAALWESVRRLCADPEARESLCRRSREFALRALDDGSYPALGTVLGGLLRTGGAGR